MTFEELLAEVRKLLPMTKDERDEQAMSFAYGNLACTTNHKPTRRAFEALSAGKGWSKERFDAWANKREWW